MVNSILESLGLPSEAEPLCVQFCNTVGSRGSDRPNEYLAKPSDLSAWMQNRQLLGSRDVVDEGRRARALALRDAIYRVLAALASDREPGDRDLEILNAELGKALARLAIGVDLHWTLTEGDSFEQALMLISLSTVAVLSGPDRSRIRECANRDCGWLFIDGSKNRSRRWCSMSDCGNLAKARRFQARRKSRDVSETGPR